MRLIQNHDLINPRNIILNQPNNVSHCCLLLTLLQIWGCWVREKKLETMYDKRHRTSLLKKNIKLHYPMAKNNFSNFPTIEDLSNSPTLDRAQNQLI
jgi:hypothetical protein